MKVGLTKEYISNGVDGTLNMKEIRNFFGGKVMKIENEIVINNLSPAGVNLNDVKNKNHKLLLSQRRGGTIADVQLKLSSPNITLEIEITKILKEYLKAKIKESETFDEISIDKTYFNSIDKAIEEYIEENLLFRYTFKELVLYTQYENTRSESTKSTNTELPVYNLDVKKPQNIDKRFQIEYTNQNRTIKVNYTMSKPFNEFNLDYYFDIKFVKK